eukprot:366367-Chlamydomonas_euryale.AAC.22
MQIAAQTDCSTHTFECRTYNTGIWGRMLSNVTGAWQHMVFLRTKLLTHGCGTTEKRLRQTLRPAHKRQGGQRALSRSRTGTPAARSLRPAPHHVRSAAPGRSSPAARHVSRGPAARPTHSARRPCPAPPYMCGHANMHTQY